MQMPQRHPNTCTYTHTDISTHMYKYTHACMHTRTHAHTHTHTHTTQAHSTHTCSHMFMLAGVWILLCTYVFRASDFTVDFRGNNQSHFLLKVHIVFCMSPTMGTNSHGLILFTTHREGTFRRQCTLNLSKKFFVKTLELFITLECDTANRSNHSIL